MCADIDERCEQLKLRKFCTKLPSLETIPYSSFYSYTDASFLGTQCQYSLDVINMVDVRCDRQLFRLFDIVLL